MNFKNCKFDIIVVAGQSNAEGNGILETLKQFHNDDIFQLTNDDLTIYGYGFIDYKPTDEFKIDYANYRKSNYRYSMDFSETFAESYIKNGFLKKGRKVLIVKAAVGGTGFSLAQWGIGNPLHTRLKNMIDYALSLNSENKLVAFLWHQGEHDAFEQPDLTPASRREFYYNALISSLEDIRSSYNLHDLPIIAGEMVNDWADKFKETTSAVENATKKVCEDIGNAAMATSEGLISNAQTTSWSSDDIHFSAASIEELGKRYFELYTKILSAK